MHQRMIDDAILVKTSILTNLRVMVIKAGCEGLGKQYLLSWSVMQRRNVALSTFLHGVVQPLKNTKDLLCLIIDQICEFMES